MTPPVSIAVPEAAGGSRGIADQLVPEASADITRLRRRLAAILADVSRLARPRIALMVLATVVTAYWLTGGGRGDSVNLLGLLAGTALVAASSSIANQILERDTDRAEPW